MIQLLRNQMILVPKLYDSLVRDATQNQPSRSAPVRRENRLPDHKDRQLVRLFSLQYFFGCGGPPQTSWSSRG